MIEKTKNNIASTDTEEINRLRDVVLKWVDTQKADNQQKNKPTKIASKVKTTVPNPSPPLVNQSLKQKHKFPKYRLFFILPLLTVLLFFILFSGYLYAFHPVNQVVIAVTKIIPYPIMFVDYRAAYYYTWAEQVSSLNNFYSKQLSDTTFKIPPILQTEKHILDRMIEDSLIKNLANHYGLKVSQSEIDSQIKKLTTFVGSTNTLAGQLDNLYGWNVSQFKQELLEPLLLKNKVALAITLDDRLNQPARQKAQEVLQKIKVDGESFEKMAQEYSQDVTAVQGGDLGYFTKGEMVPEFEQAAFSLGPGQMSDIVKTRFGYHIIKVVEKINDETGSISQIRASHILIRSKDLDAYLSELKHQIWVMRLIKV
ncbi:MAG: peptidylprolyl isomerase [Patescibacteria group bacterium]|nr:peptidylprolyl isomerase [Patescibacteria group bacterium]